MRSLSCCCWMNRPITWTFRRPLGVEAWVRKPWFWCKFTQRRSNPEASSEFFFDKLVLSGFGSYCTAMKALFLPKLVLHLFCGRFMHHKVDWIWEIQIYCLGSSGLPTVKFTAKILNWGDLSSGLPAILQEHLPHCLSRPWLLEHSLYRHHASQREEVDILQGQDGNICMIHVLYLLFMFVSEPLF